MHKSKTDGNRLSIMGGLEMDPIKLTSGTSCGAVAVGGLRLGSKISKSAQSKLFGFFHFLEPTSSFSSLRPHAIFPTQLASLEANTFLMMYHTWRTYPLVMEQREKHPPHMIDEQMGI